MGLLVETFCSYYILVIVMATLIQLGQCAHALSGYDSGYNHGCDDAKIADPAERYINEPKKGPSSHTDRFMQGYQLGFDSCSIGQSNNTASSAAQPTSNAVSKSSSINSDDQISFGVAIFIALLVVSIIVIKKIASNNKYRQRRSFTDSVKENVLKRQGHRCANCKRILNVVDWHHKNGDRSNNSKSNCLALCPNCHAVKTRSNRK